MVRRVLRLVYKEVRGLHQAAYVLALFTFTSQLLALVRDRILAHQFGAGIDLDIYYAAFRVPDLMYVLFASSLSVYVLIPFVTERISKTDTSMAAQLLSQVATVFLLSYTAVAAVAWVCAPYLVPIIAPGLTAVNESIVLVMRVLLLQPLLLGLSSLCGVVTQIGHRFVLYAISPLLYNLGIIFGIVALYPFFGLAGLAYGVVIGALGHVLVQVPLVRGSDLSFGLTRKIEWSMIASILRTSIPRALTLASQQIALVAFVALASLMTVGSVTVFQFAYNLQSVPLAVVGASYSIAAFPLLAEYYAEKKYDKFRQHVLSALRHIIFWSMPIIALVIVLRAQVVRVVLGSGAFDWADTRLTAAVLALLCVSLVSQAVTLLIIRTFYAGGYTRLPFFTTLFSAVVATAGAYTAYTVGIADSTFFAYILSIFRVQDVLGAEIVLLALAFTGMTVLQSILLLFFAVRAFSLPVAWLWQHSARAFAAAVVGGCSSYLTLNFIVVGINQNVFIGIFMQGLIGGMMGIMAVIMTYYILRSPELSEISNSFKARIFKTDVIASQDDTL